MLNYLICKKEEERAEQLICICNTFKAFVLFLEKKNYFIMARCVHQSVKLNLQSTALPETGDGPVKVKHTIFINGKIAF